MGYFAAVFILLLGGLLLAACGLSLVRHSPPSAGRRLLHIASTLVVMYGGTAFFGQAFSAAGGLTFLSSSVEWPAGYARNVVPDSQGQYIVPLTNVGRVQVYDAEGRFLRGWFVDASGGTFKLHITDEDRIEVFTARKHLRYLFSSDGTLLEQGSHDPQSYADLPASPVLARTFATPWLLWPFSSPLLAWGVVVLGFLGFALLDHLERKRKAGRQVGTSVATRIAHPQR